MAWWGSKYPYIEPWWGSKYPYIEGIEPWHCAEVSISIRRKNHFLGRRT